MMKKLLTAVVFLYQTVGGWAQDIASPHSQRENATLSKKEGEQPAYPFLNVALPYEERVENRCRC